ncbi:MAG: PKD domain-containing protein [Terriglobales bacterium]
MRVSIRPQDGTYTIAQAADLPIVLRARVAAEVNHEWITSTDYPDHQVSESSFEDVLGKGHQVTVTSRGLPERPVLTYTIRTYDEQPFGDVQVVVSNQGASTLSVESVRCLEATGESVLNLGARESSDRVLSDSFSEDWPPLRIYDLGQAPGGMHRAVGSQLVYNQQSKASVFFGALSSDRFLTIMHLKTRRESNGPRIESFTIDSTGTTEIQGSDPESGLHDGPAANLVELNLPLVGGGSVSSERLMFAAGTNYLTQLENYGAAIRTLHHGRIPEENMLGWWSWTSYYTKIAEGSAFTNAQWLAQHLKSLGYDYFHFDLGYGYSRNEYTTPNASQFPHGMGPLTQNISRLGLKIGVWTAPFEVGERSWVYEHHKDWLVQNSSGQAIQITTAEEVPSERVFVLDTTDPGAQDHLRDTYRRLVNQWGVRYIKLDFMDNTAIEGRYFRPNTTALEAQRIGLEVIRSAVGEHVLLDKDGSPMLNPVGLVDDGRISQDTGHLFVRSKEAAPGIAARFYMHRNFFLSDPDAFTVSRQLMEEREIQAPLALNEAQVSIALSAVSGGLFEIGDDLPTLGADADRVTLLTNPYLLQMARLGRASVPLDLLSYRAEDEQPSVFLLRADRRQSRLTVFNWTEQDKSRTFSLSDLNLPAGRGYKLLDGLEPAHRLALEGDSIRLDIPAHSVRLVAIVDSSIPAAAPAAAIQAPKNARVGEDIEFVCQVETEGVPVLAYRWDFGDGTSAEGKKLNHTFTVAGNHNVRLVVEGLDGVSAEERFTVNVSGTVSFPPPTRFQTEH